MASLSWWFAPHPAWEPGEDWPQEVPVVKYETDDEVVLIDPFLPLSGDFDLDQKPVRVLLTQPAHYRGTADFSTVTKHRSGDRRKPYGASARTRRRRAISREVSRQSNWTASRSRSSSSSATMRLSSPATC